MRKKLGLTDSKHGMPVKLSEPARAGKHEMCVCLLCLWCLCLLALMSSAIQSAAIEGWCSFFSFMIFYWYFGISVLIHLLKGGI